MTWLLKEFWRVIKGAADFFGEDVDPEEDKRYM